MVLARNIDLNEPKKVLNFIANRNVTNGTKQSLCYAYKKYCKQYQIEAQIPFYQPEPKPIKLPTKEKLQIFITNASKRLSTKLTLSMETGLRPLEVHNLKVKDMDLEQRLIYPTTKKHGIERPPLKISKQLQKMLSKYTANKDQNEVVFPQTTAQYGKNFRHLRNRLAEKLQDPTLKNIRLYDFRHYFCTKKLQDLPTYNVMRLMVHKRLETTQRYMHYLDMTEKEWKSAEANTKQEAMRLIDQGYEYVTDIDGTKLFRKRK
jgi:integrase